MPVAPSTVGGQAVIEGVMMRAGAGLAVAVRRPSGEIVVRDRVFRSVTERLPVLKLPLLRGVVVLVETLAGGLDALTFSAEQAEESPAAGAEARTATVAQAQGASEAAAATQMGTAEQAGSESQAAAASGASTVVQAEAPAEARSAASRLATTLTLSVALLFGLGLFVALPHALAYLVGLALGGLALKSVAFQLVAGGFKLAIFVGYLALLSRIPDIRRVFMYHGAEHMAIATYEAGEPLEVRYARTHSTFHARCGTSFLLVVVVAAIVLFAVVFPLMPWLGNGLDSHLEAIGIKVPLLLPVAGLAYEVNRVAARRLASPLVRLFVAPGFWMQRLTTRQPTDDMLEVSLSSLKAALRRSEEAAAAGADSVVVYRDFADLQARLV